MSWTRLDDGWVDQKTLADLPIETRWHYLCMIQFCSRTRRYDGYIRSVDARRCSDVEDPERAIRALIESGLIRPAEGGYTVDRMEEDHAPPPWVRKKAENDKQAQRRSRAHRAGDHSICLPQSCKSVDIQKAPDSHDDIQYGERDDAYPADGNADDAPDRRTGQDRPVQEVLPESEMRDLDRPASSERNIFPSGDPWAGQDASRSSAPWESNFS